MFKADYFIWLLNPNGERIAELNDFVSLKYSRVVNGVGTLSISLPLQRYDYRMFERDSRIEVWRGVDGGIQELDTETVWFVQFIERSISQTGEQTLNIVAHCANFLLNHRIIWYAAGSPQARKNRMPADDMMKEIMRENFGSSATDTNRQWSSLVIADDTSMADTLSLSFSWRQVLACLQEIANSSTENGTYLAFDITSRTGVLYFDTYTGWRGADHSFSSGINPVILSSDAGNLTDISRITDYRAEKTVVIAAGQGEGESRTVRYAKAIQRIQTSPFGWREKFADARGSASSSVLSYQAFALLQRSRPLSLFTGKILSVPGCRYGKEWRFGDMVTAEFDGETFDVRIDALTITVINGGEEIEAWLRN